jgi:hypothetical protein
LRRVGDSMLYLVSGTNGSDELFPSLLQRAAFASLGDELKHE